MKSVLPITANFSPLRPRTFVLKEDTPDTISTELEAVTTRWSFEFLMPKVTILVGVIVTSHHWELEVLLHNGVSEDYIKEPGDYLKHLLMLPYLLTTVNR